MKINRAFSYLTTVLSGVAVCTNVLAAQPTVFSGTGLSAATTEFTNFRNAIKAATNVDGNKISWDGVKLDGTDANPNTVVIHSGKTVQIPVDRFKNTGVIFADPYAVSADGFATANPATNGQFPAFSVNNTFAMFDPSGTKFEDLKIQQNFVLPNTTTQAGTRGFGAIFIDVEQEGSSSIEYFGRDAANKKISLGKYYVKPNAKSGEPQFLGVLYNAPIVSDVEITPGTRALFSFDGKTLKSFGAENFSKGIDLAVTDDFFFAVPETLQNSTAKQSDAECLLNWAEKYLPSLLYPAGAATLSLPPYTYRYYKASNVYVGISFSDNHIYYVDSKSNTYDVGTFVSWLNTAKCP